MGEDQFIEVGSRELQRMKVQHMSTGSVAPRCASLFELHVVNNMFRNTRSGATISHCIPGEHASTQAEALWKCEHVVKKQDTWICKDSGWGANELSGDKQRIIEEKKVVYGRGGRWVRGGGWEV